uniref:Kazal-like domain-containing protein n=1 Tax=Erpetoichthys calabaricus TaxID=27687 RepID=A0A8C4XGJ2_ERPCA
VIEPDCDQYDTHGCARSWDPVCGTNGRSYDNECFLCSDIVSQRDSMMVTDKASLSFYLALLLCGSEV